MKVEKPCTENFSAMEKNGLGRHCSLCNKTAVDFTKMSTNEIQKHLSSATGEVCGRFKSLQLEQKNDFEKVLYKLRESVFGLNIKPLRLASLALFSGIMTFMNSCMGKVIYKEPKQDPKTDSLQIKQTTSDKK